ncbi:uncharacterized protein LOC143222866 [Tachypleus tridentatus]|uniref:uncharacterized protein LOC143222866 n=1 Tax=Tachypleus tridentatus TaxID=6853 RepID=UPI003FCFACF5
MVNRMDVKVKMDWIINIYHANLVKKYFEREENLMGAASETQMDITGVVVIDTEPEDLEFVIRGENLLDLRPLGEDEMYKDVNISEELSAKCKELQDLLCQYVYVFRNRPSKTNLVQHIIETTTRDPVKVLPYQMP